MQCFICELEGQKRNGYRIACRKHQRMYGMRLHAKSEGKYVPSYDELERIWPEPFVCFVCHELMTLGGFSGHRKHVASLQHNRDSTIAIICVSCNFKHGVTLCPERQFYDELNASNKFCPRCKQIKLRNNFYTSKGETCGLSGYCKQCESERKAISYIKKRETYAGSFNGNGKACSQPISQS